MRVLFLTHSFPRYSGDMAGAFLLRLATALAAQDIEVMVLAPAAPGFPEREKLQGIAVERVRYAPRSLERIAYTGTMAEQVRASWAARFALAGLLATALAGLLRHRRSYRPDMIHAHWWFPAGLVARVAAGAISLPLVTTLHGSDVRLARSTAASRSLARVVLRGSAAVTAVSRWLAREARAMAPDVRPIVAPMPVATELFSEGGGARGDRLLFVGRLNRQKGLEYLLRALPLLERPVGLDVVGGGEQELLMRELAHELGVAERVQWYPAQPQSSLSAFYRRASALVVPSLEEGLGLVAVEALLCGAPVVAADSGGLPDVVRDRETGLLVPPAEPEALARALNELLGRPEWARSLAEAGRTRALATFSPDAVARRYADIYLRAVAGDPS